VLLALVCTLLCPSAARAATPLPGAGARWHPDDAALQALPLPTRPAVAVLSDCSYAGAQVGFDARGLLPRQRVTIEVMPGLDPRAGAPISARDVTANALGQLIALLDVPATGTTRAVIRSVRVRPSPDASTASPTILGAATMKTAARSVTVAPATARARARSTQRFTLTGLPEGTPLWAHYRHAGKTVASVALGSSADPCGRARFALPTLPRGHERPGAWDVWITTSRTYRPLRSRIHVERRMTVTGRGPNASVRLEPLRSRLVPADPRAVAPETHFLAADATRIGVVRGIFADVQGAPVTFYERVGDRVTVLGSARAAPGENTILEDATTWSCTRLTRRIMASATLRDGFHATGVDTIRTPSCANRFRIRAPRAMAPGREIVLRVADRWGIGGITPRLCVAAPGRRGSCRPLRFPRAVTVASQRFRATSRGVWRVDLQVSGTHTRVSVSVGTGGPSPQAVPTLLATGDSMMFGIDSFLGDELAGLADVHSDVRPGTGVSKLASDWMRIAAEQVRAHRPRRTVIMLGAADGFPMSVPGGASVSCCGAPWVAEYARRAQAMMRTYERAGRGRVYWLTVPTPRQAERWPIIAAVNAAIRQGVAAVPGATVVALDALFTPHGYRDVVRYRGREVRVRDVDGLHLNVQGQAIAAKAVARIIRAQR
jgi:lysophospholipase L1-like esterase